MSIHRFPSVNPFLSVADRARRVTLATALRSLSVTALSDLRCRRAAYVQVDRRPVSEADDAAALAAHRAWLGFACLDLLEPVAPTVIHASGRFLRIRGVAVVDRELRASADPSKTATLPDAEPAREAHS